MQLLSKTPLIFFLKNDEFNEERLDVDYFHPKYLDNKKELLSSKYPIKTLDEISVLIKDGPHHTPTFVDKGILFLQKGDIKEGEIDFARPKKITKEFHAQNPLTQATQNDILIRKIGVGPREAVVVPANSPPLHIFVTVALIRLKREYNPYYVEIFLNSSLGRNQTERRNKGIGSPCLHLEDIRTIEIPIPPPKIQNKIVRIILNARRKRKQLIKTVKEKREKNLEYLKKLLSLKSITKTDNAIYVIKNLEDRLDAHYYDPNYRTISDILMAGKFKPISLRKLVSFTENIIDPESEYANSDFTYIQIQDIDENDNKIISFTKTKGKEASSRARIKVSTNDILVPTLGGSSKSVVLVPKQFNDAIVSTGFTVLRVTDSNLRVFLLYFFKSDYFQLQFKQQLTGTIMPSVSRKQLGDILIPNPDKQTLKRFADFAIKQQNLIEKMKKEANDAVDDAKKITERLFLG